MEKEKTKKFNGLTNLLLFVHNHIQSLSSSKLFVGMMIILLNISSKFVTINLSKSMESYLKYTFSRNILIFAMCFIGSRDIYVAIFITSLFILFMDYLLNEKSAFCILPESFKEYHISKIESMESGSGSNQPNGQSSTKQPPTTEQINDAIRLLSSIKTLS
jgi:hypothetical protein